MKEEKIINIISMVFGAVKTVIFALIGVLGLIMRSKSKAVVMVKEMTIGVSGSFIIYKVLVLFIPEGAFAFGALAFVTILCSIILPMGELYCS